MALGKLWNNNVYSYTVVSRTRVSSLYSPHLTCRNRCLSYTPFGVSHFFFFFFFFFFKVLNHLIVIHFRTASDVCSASIHLNHLHSKKSTQHCLTRPVANSLLWIYIALKSHGETTVCTDFISKLLFDSHTCPWVTGMME